MKKVGRLFRHRIGKGKLGAIGHKTGFTLADVRNTGDKGFHITGSGFEKITAIHVPAMHAYFLRCQAQAPLNNYLKG